MFDTLLLAHSIDALAQQRTASGENARDALLRRRPPRRVVRHSVDYAETLLDRESVIAALRALPRHELRALHTDPRTADAAYAFGLVGTCADTGDRVAIRRVTDTLAQLLDAHEVTFADAAESAPATAAPERAPDSVDRVDTVREVSDPNWYAEPLLTVLQATASLRFFAEQPGQVGKRGATAAATEKQLVSALGFDRETAARVVRVLRRADLLAAYVDHSLHPTPAATAWLQQSHSDRWATLVLATSEALPEGWWSLTTGFGDAFPLASEETLEQVAVLEDDLAALGFGAPGTPSRAAQPLPRPGDLASVSPLAAATFPRPVDGIIIQPDLSVVVPGPLTPDAEDAVWTVTTPERLGLASTLRITSDRLVHAISRGHTAEELRELLSRWSLTGIPQPLDYLLRTVGEPGRTVSVSAGTGVSRAQLDVHTAAQRATLLADRRLAHLQLRPDTGASPQHRLLSNLSPEHVVAALTDAGHTALLTTRGERSTPPVERLVTTAARRAHEQRAVVAESLAALREAPPLEEVPRLLELAIRDRIPLRLTATAGDTEVTFAMLPLAMSSDRLRARDLDADVERTLPLASILTVAPISAD